MEEVGGFDEGFFHYVEESDLFRQIRARDRRIIFVPEARIVHSGSGASQSISLKIRDRWKVDGFLLYATKHHGKLGRRRTYRALLGAQSRLLMARILRECLVWPECQDDSARTFEVVVVDVEIHPQFYLTGFVAGGK